MPSLYAQKIKENGGNHNFSEMGNPVVESPWKQKNTPRLPPDRQQFFTIYWRKLGAPVINNEAKMLSRFLNPNNEQLQLTLKCKKSLVKVVRE